MAADWKAIRVEYVSGSDTFGRLAKRHGLKEDTVRKRAGREGWQTAREAAARAVTEKAEAVIGAGRIDELIRFNADDLKMARALRAKAAKMLSWRDKDGQEVPISATDLRALASTVDTAQKVGRLALGMTTENTGLSGPNGGPVEVNTGAREALHAKLLR